MIPRYSLPKFTTLWSTENKYATWLRVELATCQAMEHFGIIPDGIADKINAIIPGFSGFSITEIEEIELEVKHDVIAFLTYIEKSVGSDARWLHYGMTSSDLVDTATAVILYKINALLFEKFKELDNTFRIQIEKYRHTVMMGRSHGMHAEPITFGLMLAGHLTEFKRAYRRFLQASEGIAFGKLSGAVGTYAHLSPEIERYAMDLLNLQPEPVSTQIIPRDRYAEYLTALAIAAAAIERLATNIRHLQRSEVAEVREEFSAGQKGSSAMPHKRNPVTCENLCGLARLMRGMTVPAIEDIALWHERDISHSAVERFILPDSTSLLGYMLDKTNKLLKSLFVDTLRMEENLASSHNLYCSEAVLLALVKAGLSRQEAYAIIQRAAMEAYTTGKNLRDTITKTQGVPLDILDVCFDFDYALRHVDSIIDRALKDV